MELHIISHGVLTPTTSRNKEPGLHSSWSGVSWVCAQILLQDEWLWALSKESKAQWRAVKPWTWSGQCRTELVSPGRERGVCTVSIMGCGGQAALSPKLDCDGYVCSPAAPLKPSTRAGRRWGEGGSCSSSFWAFAVRAGVVVEEPQPGRLWAFHLSVLSEGLQLCQQHREAVRWVSLVPLGSCWGWLSRSTCAGGAEDLSSAGHSPKNHRILDVVKLWNKKGFICWVFLTFVTLQFYLPILYPCLWPCSCVHWQNEPKPYLFVHSRCICMKVSCLFSRFFAPVTSHCDLAALPISVPEAVSICLVLRQGPRTTAWLRRWWLHSGALLAGRFLCLECVIVQGWECSSLL